MTDLRIVFMTAPTEEVAVSIVRGLVEERYIACGNIIPRIRSIYRWEEGIQDSAEVMVLMKCRPDGFEALRRRIVELHPYEVPEILSVRADRVHPDYARWVMDQTD